MTNGSKTTGTVFDIQRGAVTDGPGIRTTVFLKGCPLRCTWCHNPESQPIKPQLRFYADKCQNCFECVSACPTGTHIDSNGKHSVRFDRCDLTGNCVTACPNEALEIVGQSMTVDDVMQVVRRDIAYYRNSGGGLTLSGGEPMLQFEFAKALFSAAKQEGIHTTLDTSGYASCRHFQEILPITDLFLFDYKATEPELHERTTGVSNQLIFENLDFLYQQKANILLRCPMIPTVNDTEEHLRAIAALQEKYPNLAGIEIMPYHNMGRKKGQEVGLERDKLQVGTTPGETKSRWRKQLEEFGLAEVMMN
ncbi:MAG: glycyl-radical enzyme activating protein [Candidatus Marinimicrobia bacterium]|nr:glycyl-radical enzyme activating protein [Candidatus Neomarinimicrobiota bacterium]